ncbi:MAG: hypothetical protein VW963_05810 [Candidatus Neomarinimicrobiota bacterium]
METKNLFNFKLILCLSIGIYSSQFLDADPNQAESTFKFQKSIDSSKIALDEKNPLKNKTILLDKIFNKSNKEILRGVPNNNLVLNNGEYIRIKNVDKRTLLFDGAIRIQFKNIPNLESFINLHELQIIEDLSDIKIVVFKVKNILELESIINEIKNDENINSIELNTLDPFIEPQ